MTASVFDASALVKLVHEEPGSCSARAAYEECGAPMAPDWAMLECSQALWRKTRTGGLTPEQALRRYEALSAIRLHLVDSAQLTHRTLSVALAAQHPVYDCLYIVLARGEGAALVTADAQQRDLAQRAGVDVTWIESRG